MNDQERAQAIFAEWFGDAHDPDEERAGVVAEAVALMAAARLHERRLILAFLEREVHTLSQHGFSRPDADLVAGLARRVARGEHEVAP